jgi:N-acetylglucosaminyldiphosphoundecaprenol N-acetyl-beta-D-mannosaminyltransferase
MVYPGAVQLYEPRPLPSLHHSSVEQSLIDGAYPVVADGMPLIWASRLAGEPLPERVSGSIMVWSVCEIASARRQ